MELQGQQYRLSGGIDPLSLVEQYDAPLYIYDTAVMKRQYDRLSKAFPVPSLRINYAVKALNNINVLQYFKQLGAGLDCVSIQEVWLGLKAGFSPEDIVFTPNGVSFEEMEMAMQAGVRINIDSINMLEEFGAEFPEKPVCIRINPHIMAGEFAKTSVGHVDSKFGISIYQLPHVVRVVEALGMKVEGVHMHTGSGILDADVFLRGADILFDAARKFKDLEYIDFGSGFKVPYREGDHETDIEELGEKLTSRFIDFCREYGKDLTLVFEPGKFLVCEGGYFLVRVNQIKQTTSTIFAQVDSGLNHLIRPMFYDAYHHIVNVSRPVEKPRIYTVVGYICETDTFGVDRKIAEIQDGDVLAFLNAGAYCFSMASNYNSRFRPAEVMVHDGQAHLVRHRETMEDLLRNQVMLDVFQPKVKAGRS